jgi:phosphoserine phosphatase RsbU/P
VLGQRWWLVVTSDLDRVDQMVTPIFREVILWAGFLMLAVTTILVSTTVQLIRGRMRLERVQHEMLNKELMQAREIQLNWLPDQHCANPRIDLAAINRPASHVSGDFYNWFELPDGRLVVTIGDVTGHGMAAAFLMATTQLLVRTTMMRVGDPGRCLEEVNHQLCVQVFNGQFVTMQIVVIDLEKGELLICTAGHPAPLIGEGESFSPLPIEPQLVLGVDADIPFETQRFSVGKGASVLLYTDGVIDAQSDSGDRYNVEGLAASLCRNFDNAQAIVDAVVEAIDDFRGGRELADDLTLVAIQLQGAPELHPQLVAAK